MELANSLSYINPINLIKKTISYPLNLSNAMTTSSTSSNSPVVSTTIENLEAKMISLFSSVIVKDNNCIMFSKSIPRTLPKRDISGDVFNVYVNFSYFINGIYYQHILIKEIYSQEYHQNLLSDHEFVKLSELKDIGNELDLFTYNILLHLEMINYQENKSRNVHLGILDDFMSDPYLNSLIHNLNNELSLENMFIKHTIISLFGNKQNKFIDMIFSLEHLILNPKADKFLVVKIVNDLNKRHISQRSPEIITEFVHSLVVIFEKKSRFQMISEIDHHKIIEHKCNIWRLLPINNFKGDKGDIDLDKLIKLFITFHSYILFKKCLKDYENNIIDFDNIIYSIFVRTSVPNNEFFININEYHDMLEKKDLSKLKELISKTDVIKYVNEKIDCIHKELIYHMDYFNLNKSLIKEIC